jgi:hypothetical protein
MHAPICMRDAVSGTTGDHLVIRTNQLACWVLCDQPRGTRTRVARAILENRTTIPKERATISVASGLARSDRPTTRVRVSFGDCKVILPHRANAAELLDVDVDELTRIFALIAPDRFSGFQGIQLIQAEPEHD